MAERSILDVTGGHVNVDSTGSEVKASLKKEVIPGQCCIPPPFCDYQGLGTEETWNSMPVYITTPKSPTSSAVLIISDIYGWQVPQTRLLADKIAAAGHYVVVPDFMENDFFGSSDPNDEYAGLPEYLARHSMSKAIAEAKEILRKVQAMGFNSIGGAGFCWGTKILVSLLKGDTPLAAAIMCHPSFITNDEMKEVKVPLVVLGAEIDIVTAAAQVMEYGAILHDNAAIVGSESYVKIYKGADHGWTTRYNLNDVEARNRAETAHEEIIAWFKNRLSNPTAAL
ncbi:hypothetical protein KC19_6G156800 [Ceratodon purpureus]|uniref:Dienelactone hydrolase domain-containing protein n=1 Tax=Ceratodon purpureus TaxID=3225 RepID=A0A8T0HFF2_CERPU|nr:hypothetical protein KC19_6G156800 [Ceratodon purpureus]